MKPKTISLGLKRDVRHERFNITQCSAQLTYEFEQGDELSEVVNEVHDQLVEIIEAMVEEEIQNHREKLDALKNKPKEQ